MDEPAQQGGGRAEERDDAVRRLWDGDHTVIQEDPADCADRLGWLRAPAASAASWPRWALLPDEIADGAGELGFFPPYSWWPLWCSLGLSAAVFGVAMGAWWLVIIAGVLGGVALTGWIYEYYRGEHAH